MTRDGFVPSGSLQTAELRFRYANQQLDRHIRSHERVAAVAEARVASHSVPSPRAETISNTDRYAYKADIKTVFMNMATRARQAAHYPSQKHGASSGQIYGK